MHAVIMAGGAGTRFWPASRRLKPKQFLNITGQGPMLVETCDRLLGMVRYEEMIIVLGREHEVEARNLLGGRDVHLVAEPMGRNTGPCIGLGAMYARHLEYEGAIAFLPADHFIGDKSAFLKALDTAASLAMEGGIVTLGIIPSRPETGYGYIRAGKKRDVSRHDLPLPVSAFVEKPDLKKAEMYMASGEYFWNAGIFVASAETILREIQIHMPLLFEGLMSLDGTLGTPDFGAKIEQVYSKLEGVSFDYGVMEKKRKGVQVVPLECGWSDVGSWESLYDLKRGSADAMSNVFEGNSVLRDCENSLVFGQGGRFIACLNLKNCLVVDTKDALLVADLRRSQDIRQIVEQLKKEGKTELL